MKSEMTLQEYRDWLAAAKAARPPRTEREHQEQVALFEWAALHQAKCGELGLLFAIPNGGDRHPAVAAKLKAEGVKSGVPDLFLPVVRLGYAGLWIELKAEGGTLQEEQSAWLYALAGQGYMTATCFGWQAAARRIVAYLGHAFQEFGL